MPDFFLRNDTSNDIIQYNQMNRREEGMRKLLTILLIALIISSSFLPGPGFAVEASKAAGRRGLEIPQAFIPRGGSIIASSETGQILWQEDADKPWIPLSITKAMSIYLIYQAMDLGKFTLETEIPVTPEIEQLSTYFYISNNEMKQGATYTVSELIDLAILASSSAAVMMLIWETELTHGEFVTWMNETAAELGMTDTTFYNAVGAPNTLMGNYPAEGYPAEEQNISTAQDIAVLSAHLIKEYPEVLNHTNIVRKTFQEGTDFEETFETYLITLEGASYGIPGADGIKTGSGGDSGYNMSMTAKRDDTRLIGVLLGVGDWYDYDAPEYRSGIMKALFDDAFDDYEYRLVLPKGEHEIDQRTLITEQDLYDIVPKGQDPGVKLVDNTFQLNVEGRTYLKGYGPPSVSFIDPVAIAEARDAATRARRLSTKNLISPIVVTIMFAGLWLWGQMAARKNQ